MALNMCYWLVVSISLLTSLVECQGFHCYCDFSGPLNSLGFSMQTTTIPPVVTTTGTQDGPGFTTSRGTYASSSTPITSIASSTTQISRSTTAVLTSLAKRTLTSLTYTSSTTTPKSQPTTMLSSVSTTLFVSTGQSDTSTSRPTNEAVTTMKDPAATTLSGSLTQITAYAGANYTGPAAYTAYSGSGESWPSVQEWLSLDTLITINRPYLGVNCDPVVPNSATETEQLLSAVEDIAELSRVDSRIILATLLEESNGCVRVRTTYSSQDVVNPGLLQDYNGTYTCMDVTPPCPDATITGMIYEGVMATRDYTVAGLLQERSDTRSCTLAQCVYQALRLYNGGRDTSLADLSGPSDGTASYARDIANRLVGWDGVQR